MKKLLLFAATAALFFACTPENSSDDTPSGDTTVKVIGVSVNKTVELRVGETVTLKAVVSPGNASDKSVSWTSDKEDVATVDQSGKVTAVKAGTATVTVKTNDGGMTAECWVVVKAPVAVTGTKNARGVTPTTAVLGGYLNLEKPYPGDLVVGVQYSKSADMPKSGTTTAEFTLDTENKDFEGRVLDLEPGTTYYYRSFADTGGKENHGEIMTLTTGSLESLIKTLDATEIGGTHATFNCSLHEQLSAYKQWYKNSVFSNGFYFQDKFVEKGLIPDAKNFSKVVSDLAEKTTYSYKAFVKFGDKIYYGEAKKFTTGTAVTDVYLNNKTAALEVGSSCTLVPTGRRLQECFRPW
ncbi:MAG: Ig-like domain-containing protein [Bacteroidales bacterium]|nr:Ig-like domain-containing protein [Bacteroidales bacterium]